MCNACHVSATRMMILGAVRLMQPVHGYDVRRELLSWGADRWANVQPGSIYHGLRKLTEESMLREVGTDQVGGRPARTSYEITSKGLAEFETLLRDLWWNAAPPTDPFFAALSFLPSLPRSEATSALRHRATVLRATVDGMKASLESRWISELKPTHVAWMFELSIARMAGEIDWCERIADLIDSGVSYTPDTLRESPEFAEYLERSSNTQR
ncbi:Transcriptional regulator PadR-like family protein [Asanoa hainanensis]|uniref:Transcriptional regulator PadR-like family protein n=1 Tax=Asanoa hainanensis TaxID=560556 RepID=A0A239KLG3_9ACTN|nr:Transcriptional regulator PadR-like family protein [Asanoa hainanensis]